MRFVRTSRKAHPFSFLFSFFGKIFASPLDKMKKHGIIMYVPNIAASPSGKATDSDSVIS